MNRPESNFSVKSGVFRKFCSVKFQNSCVSDNVKCEFSIYSENALLLCMCVNNARVYSNKQHLTFLSAVI